MVKNIHFKDENTIKTKLSNDWITAMLRDDFNKVVTWRGTIRLSQDV